MRILALDLGADWRGGQRQTHLVSAGLAARGHAVRVAARAGAPLAAEVSRNGVPRLDVVELPAGSEAAPSLLFALARAARAFAPDVLYAGDGRSHGAAVWSGTARRAPLVVHRRVVFPPGRDPFSRIKYRAASRYLAVSGAVKDALVAAGIPERKVVVLADGLPSEAYVNREAPATAPFRLVHVGAFDGRKGQEVVVGVLARLAEERRSVAALFCGDGPARAAVEALAARRGVRERCTFAGMIADVPERLASSHVLLLPSQSEGAALALAEAMAAGCAVVAHDVGGTAELLAQGAAGILLSTLGEEAWADAVRSLLDAPERREALLLAGRAAAAERTIERTVLAIERELSGAVETAGRRT